jgi:hypothetical protein
MHIFQSTRNTRPIIKNCFKYIRSDVPTEIAEEENYSYQYIIDLHGVALQKVQKIINTL